MDGLRRYPDYDLLAEMDFARREIAQCLKDQDTGAYHLMQTRRLRLLEAEHDRRRMLEDFGGPALRQFPQDFRFRIDRIKADLDILGIADLLGIPTEVQPYNQRLRFRCPTHGDGSDRMPSGVLYLDQWRWWCYGCNGGGSGFDLVVAFGKAPTFWRAVLWLEGFLPPTTPPRPIPKAKPNLKSISFRNIIPDQ